jgi:hypothetical protein
MREMERIVGAIGLAAFTHQGRQRRQLRPELVHSRKLPAEAWINYRTRHLGLRMNPKTEWPAGQAEKIPELINQGLSHGGIAKALGARPGPRQNASPRPQDEERSQPQKRPAAARGQDQRRLKETTRTQKGLARPATLVHEPSGEPFGVHHGFDHHQEIGDGMHENDEQRRAAPPAHPSVNQATAEQDYYPEPVVLDVGDCKQR